MTYLLKLDKQLKALLYSKIFGRVQELQIHSEFSIDSLHNISRTFNSILKQYLLQAYFYPASSGFSRPDATLRWERNHCEQPFAFPSSMRFHVMTTNIQRQDGNENFNKTIGLISKTTTLHVYHAFIFAFLDHFCTTTT